MKKILSVLIALAVTLLLGCAGSLAEGDAGMEQKLQPAVGAEITVPAGGENPLEGDPAQNAAPAEGEILAEPAVSAAEAGSDEPAAEAVRAESEVESAMASVGESTAEAVLETSEKEQIQEPVQEAEEARPGAADANSGEMPSQPDEENQTPVESEAGFAGASEEFWGEDHQFGEADGQFGDSNGPEGFWGAPDLDSSDLDSSELSEAEESGRPKPVRRERKQFFSVDLSIRVEPEKLTYGDEAELILDGLESANMDFSIYWEQTDLRETVKREEDRIWREVGSYGRKLDLEVTMESAAWAYRAVLIADNNDEVISEPVCLVPGIGAESLPR